MGLRKGVARRACLVAVAGIAIAPNNPSSASAALSPTDVAIQTGIAETTTTWSATVTDVDSDGNDDVLLGRHIAVAQLFHGDGVSFTEIDQGQFLQRDRHDCAAADVDQDGRVDFYCTIGADGGRIKKHNELWLQQVDGSFLDQAHAFGVEDPFGRGRRVTFLDLNQDAYPDLFVGNTYPRQDRHRSPNRLFANTAGTGFQEVQGSGVTRELGARCVQAVDFDADGWDDLVVCGKEGRPLRLYRNTHHNSFVDVTRRYGVRGHAASAQIVDVDNNGSLDLIRIDDDSLRVQLGGISGFRKAAFAQPLREGVWVAVGDVNADGLLDVYAVQGCARGVNLRDLLLIGHGKGRFSDARIPETRHGCGGYAVALDHDGDGRDGFLVLNGQGRRHGIRITGPLQLLTLNASL
jgi:hypothetical protein